MSFSHPALLAFIPLAVAAYVWAVRLALKRDAIPYPPLQNARQKNRGLWAARLIYVTEAALIALVLTALAGPFRSFEVVSIDEEGIDVMLLVDISSSMQAKDFPPNRMEATKAILAEFVRKSGGNRVGITVFAKRVYSLSPLTVDHAVLKKLVKGLSLKTIDHYKSGGTAIGDAILYATDALKTARVKDRAQVIVLLTDGDSNDGMDVGLAVKYAVANGVKIDTIGIGATTPVTVTPDPKDPEWTFETQLVEEPLRDIARQTGGVYYPAVTGDALIKIFDELSRLERTPLSVGQFRQRKYFRLPFESAAAFCFLVATLGRTLFLRRPLK